MLHIKEYKYDIMLSLLKNEILEFLFDFVL